MSTSMTTRTEALARPVAARPAVQRGVEVLADNQRRGAMTDAERDVMFWEDTVRGAIVRRAPDVLSRREVCHDLVDEALIK